MNAAHRPPRGKHIQLCMKRATVWKEIEAGRLRPEREREREIKKILWMKVSKRRNAV